MTGAPRTAWVTGASSGIGREVALRLAGEGWDVAASARGAEALEALAREARGLSGLVRAVPADVTDPGSLAAAAEEAARAGGPHLVICNAGSHAPMEPSDFDAEAVGRLVDVNLMGTVRTIAAVLPGMLSRRSGHIVVVASVAGYRGLPTAAAYGATKAALINLCESLHMDLHGSGVRIQLVNPGFVRTPLTGRNPFPMPFLMEPDAAARRIVAALSSPRFEVTFPRRFTWILKALRLLPYALYFPLVRRSTGG